MPRSYATPLAFKTAVEQRLRNEAEASGMDLQRRRQLFVFDRFLARLFRILDFVGVERGRFRIYPLATHVAEKIHAYTLPRKRPNARVKDLPDIALLASAKDIDGAALRVAIDRILEHRATHAVPKSVHDPPTSWAPVYERIAENDGLPWRTLAEVKEAVQSFLDPVLFGNPASWHAASWSWYETPGDESRTFHHS